MFNNQTNKRVQCPSLTVASFWTSSSDAPREARPISWENWANFGSASRGTWPSSSWHVSLKQKHQHKHQQKQAPDHTFTSLCLKHGNIWVMKESQEGETCRSSYCEKSWMSLTDFCLCQSELIRLDTSNTDHSIREGSWHKDSWCRCTDGAGVLMVQVHSRFRCVERVGAVTNILSAVKHSVGQTSQEVSGRQVTCDWSNCETRSPWNTQSNSSNTIRNYMYHTSHM